MKKLIFGIIATVVFTNFTIGQTIDEMRKSNNSYNSKWESYYNFLKNTVDLVNNKKLKNQDELNEFIKKSEFNYTLKLNDLELNIYKKYFSDKTFDLNNLIGFENFILKNPDNLKDNVLLESVSLNKWFAFYLSNSTSNTNRSGCHNNCMRKKLSAIFDTGNWLDQAEFIAGIPENVLWMNISCAWDCKGFQ